MTQAPAEVLRPSSAPRWVPCVGSWQMEANYPEDMDSEEQREGTAGHHYATEGVLGRVVTVGSLAPNGYPITPEMVTGGNRYIRDVLDTVATMGPETLMRVETKVFPHTLVHPRNEGTPDTFAINLMRSTAVLWDYKFGHGYVDPFQNWQLVDYWAGIFEGLSLTRADTVNLQCSSRVIQPRNYSVEGPVRRWDCPASDIWDLIEGVLRPAAHAALGPNPPTMTGPHCKDCRARHACPTLMRVAASCMDLAGQSVPLELPGDALGEELQRLVLAEARLKARRVGLEEDAAARIRRGQPVAHWQMGRSDTREAWTATPEQVFALGNAYGVELRNNKPVTPAQARDLGVDDTVIRAYSTKPAGSLKLVPLDNKAAAKAFGKPGT